MFACDSGKAEVGNSNVLETREHSRAGIGVAVKEVLGDDEV